ncbi:hypothetical protein EG68_02299 [Paragonimus skrjabini miyazakii]|uniref:Uncharacterized protein n=1 Tax=Paragonimus skrjabini miyazakii TaxID=59628 RepID=A0A8S9Z3N0_9TREM|nr:hypothetical protein EG68_02299 [Paragonimus skrjabini miyazakii]
MDGLGGLSYLQVNYRTFDLHPNSPYGYSSLVIMYSLGKLNKQFGMNSTCKEAVKRLSLKPYTSGERCPPGSMQGAVELKGIMRYCERKSANAFHISKRLIHDMYRYKLSQQEID